MNNSFLDNDSIKRIGFRHVGENCKISRLCSIYSPESISIGDNVRIDDFVVLSGSITIGNNIHISAGSLLYGGDSGIIVSDYSNISSRCGIYAITDDFSGDFLVGPCVDIKTRNVKSSPVLIEKHCAIGTGSTVLPGVVISEGSAIGAMSLVNKTTRPWSISFGIPCKFVKVRSKKLLELVK